MANYEVALQSPGRFQFEDNSGTPSASQTNNCGVTMATRHVQFYKNQWYGIEATRRLVMGCCTPTDAWQQADMMDARGVPASARELNTLAEMHELVDDGRRPYTIGVLMSRVPPSVRDHPFLGWHAIGILGNAELGDGTRGFWVNDPNFSPIGGYRPDPDRGKKFYSNQVMNYAFLQGGGYRFAVVPDKPKAIVLPQVTVLEGAKLRFSPWRKSTNLMRIIRENVTAILLETVQGGGYDWYRPSDGRLMHDATPAEWRKVKLPNGAVGYVIRPDTRLI